MSAATPVLVVVCAVLGASMVSFFNVVRARIPRGETLLGFSHCESCAARIAPLDNVPVFSYLALGGRCRTCRARIPLGVLTSEITGAVVGGFVGFILSVLAMIGQAVL